MCTEALGDRPSTMAPASSGFIHECPSPRHRRVHRLAEGFSPWAFPDTVGLRRRPGSNCVDANTVRRCNNVLWMGEVPTSGCSDAPTMQRPGPLGFSMSEINMVSDCRLTRGNRMGDVSIAKMGNLGVPHGVCSLFPSLPHPLTLPLFPSTPQRYRLTPCRPIPPNLTLARTLASILAAAGMGISSPHARSIKL